MNDVMSLGDKHWYKDGGERKEVRGGGKGKKKGDLNERKTGTKRIKIRKGNVVGKTTANETLNGVLLTVDDATSTTVYH
ncbi:unnamed protein product [Enterobius vermicularis]|uniref:Retrotransposon protein n=1 Tax=Enterobius vermicularis TaxID=51028 RepID=A0A0N4VBI9_ENTVE|nr:unnamed protein product [Enterobius vermicularis]